MKTAISVPNVIFKEAEQLAQQMHLSRSGLYCAALIDFIKAHRKDAITKKLDAIYQNTSSSLDKPLLAAQLNVVEKEKW